MTAKLLVSARVMPDGAPFTVKGRDAWCLQQLVEAGERGCTPLTHVGPRWSAYVFKLRKMGLVIETVHEAHEGTFSGTHARYKLHSPVVILSEEKKAA